MAAKDMFTILSSFLGAGASGDYSWRGSGCCWYRKCPHRRRTVIWICDDCIAFRKLAWQWWWFWYILETIVSLLGISYAFMVYLAWARTNKLLENLQHIFKAITLIEKSIFLSIHISRAIVTKITRFSFHYTVVFWISHNKYELFGPAGYLKSKGSPWFAWVVLRRGRPG